MDDFHRWKYLVFLIPSLFVTALSVNLQNVRIRDSKELS